MLPASVRTVVYPPPCSASRPLFPACRPRISSPRSTAQIRLACNSKRRSPWARATEEHGQHTESERRRRRGAPFSNPLLSHDISSPHELSQREREWKSQMEAMRKRIEQDPYEAVFGKRFDPFWSSLFPNWIDEVVNPSASHSCVSKAPSSAPRHSNCAQDTVGISSKTDAAQSQRAATTPQEHSEPHDVNSVQSFASINKTSWDSWSNKTRREEWDSATGQTRHYEYDPISNRMVLLHPSASSDVSSNSNADIGAPSALTPGKDLSRQASVVPPRACDKKADDALESPRSAIPVPTQDLFSLQISDNSDALRAFNQTAENSKHPSISPPHITKQKDTDCLTSHDVRVEMGRKRSESLPANQKDKRAPSPEAIDIEWGKEEQHITLDRQLDMLMRIKTRFLKRSDNDVPLTEQEKTTQQKLERDIRDVSGRMRGLEADLDVKKLPDFVSSVPKELHPATHLPKIGTASQSSLQPSIDRLRQKPSVGSSKMIDPVHNDGDTNASGQKISQVPENWTAQADLIQDSRIARTHGMSGRAKEIASAIRMQEEEDYEEGDDYVPGFANSPYFSKNWGHNRTSAENTTFESLIDAELSGRKAGAQASELVCQNGQINASQNRHAFYSGETIETIPRCTENDEHSKAISAFREGSVEYPPSTAMAKSHMERYQAKCEELRAGLDMSFKQSSIQAEAHLERINALEAELAHAKAANSIQAQSVDRRYRDKIRDLREQLDQAFKQSSVQAEALVERIQALEKANHITSEQTEVAETKPDPIEEICSEGDICANVAKFANEGDRWLRKPAHVIPPAQAIPEQIPIAQAEYDEKEMSLIRELLRIYQTRYGLIDENHRQGIDMPKDEALVSTAACLDDAEPGSDLRLGKALADFDNQSKYRFETRSLEAEVAAQEKAAHESEQNLANASKEYATDQDRPQPPYADQSAQVEQNPGFAAAGGQQPADFLAGPSTGSFASPTGYVGDHWGYEKPNPVSAHAQPGPRPAEDVRAPQVTRVHRQEPVYSGSRLGQQKSRRVRRNYNEVLEEQAQRRRQRRRAFRSRVRWALSVGLGSAAIAYTVGAIAEKREHAQAERWEQILDGKKARWQ